MRHLHFANLARLIFFTCVLALLPLSVAAQTTTNSNSGGSTQTTQTTRTTETTQQPTSVQVSRTTTTIAPQALILLNSGFMEEQAQALAGRLIRETGRDPRKNIERAYRLAFGRGATDQEARIALAYLERAHQGVMDEQYSQALARLCKVILNLNETLYVD